MTTSTAPAGSSPAPLGLLSRFIGILTAPRATYENVVSRPRWLGMYVLTAVIVAFGAALPMTTDAGKQAAVDQQVSSMEAFGMQVSDAQYQAMMKGTAILPYTTGGAVLVGSLVMGLIFAAILWAVFNAALGGDASYKQLLAVVVHGSVISAVGQLFTGPLNYFRGAVSSATNLSVVLPMLDEKSFMGRLAGAIDLFVIWWLVVLAIGLAVLYRRKTQPIAFTLFGIYAVIALGIAAFMSR